MLLGSGFNVLTIFVRYALINTEKHKQTSAVRIQNKIQQITINIFDKYHIFQCEDYFMI